MARALHRPLCGALVTLALLWSSARAQPAGVPAVVERLLQGFSSADCVRRWQTIEEYTDRMIGRVLAYEEPVMDVTAGLRELAPSRGAAVEQKVQMVSDYGDEAGKAFARLAKVAATVDRSGSPLEVWRKGLSPLTKVLDDPAETFMTRRLAAAVIAESAKTSSLASVVIATGRVVASPAPTVGQIVPELIRGLDADSFAARYGSTRALLDVSKQPVDRLCVDPTDTAADRAAAIHEWQAWWEQSKGRSAAETIRH